MFQAQGRDLSENRLFYLEICFRDLKAELLLWRQKNGWAKVTKKMTKTMDFGFKRPGVETSLSVTIDNNLRCRYPVVDNLPPPFFFFLVRSVRLKGEIVLRTV